MKVLCYGDSNTYGFDPRGVMASRYPVEQVWPYRLQALLGDKWEIVENGLNGREFPKTSLTFGAVERVLKREQPDLLVVMLGTNDYVTMPQPDPRVVEVRLDRFLDNVKKQRAYVTGKLRVLVVAPPPMNLKEISFYGKYDTTDGRLTKALQESCKDAEVDFVDTLHWNIPMAHDQMHFSLEGHEIFAQRMAHELWKRYPEVDPEAAAADPFEILNINVEFTLE